MATDVLNYVYEIKPSFKMFQSVLIFEQAERLFANDLFDKAVVQAFKVEKLFREIK